MALGNDPFDPRLLVQGAPELSEARPSDDPFDPSLLRGQPGGRASPQPDPLDAFDPRRLEAADVDRGSGTQAERRLPHSDQFMEGLTSGTENLLGSFAGFNALVANELGLHGKSKEFEDQMYDRKWTAQQTQIPVQSIYDIENTGDFFDWAASASGQLFPSVALSVGGGGIGGMIGRRLFMAGLKSAMSESAIAQMVVQGYTQQEARKRVLASLLDPSVHGRLKAAQRTGLATGAWMSSAVPYAGETTAMLRGVGLNMDELAGTAGVAAVVGGTLDALPIIVMLDRFFPGVEKQLAKSFVRNFAEAAGMQAALEFGTEGTQEVVQLAAQAYHDPSFKISDAGNLERVANAAAMGALAGFLTGGAAGAVQGVQAPMQRAAKKASESVRAQRERAERVRRAIDEAWSDTPAAAESGLNTVLGGTLPVPVAPLTQGQARNDEILTPEQAVEGLKREIVGLWNENITEPLNAAFNEARRLARQAGIMNTSVGASQVSFTQRVMAELDMFTYKNVDPVIEQATTELREFVRQAEEVIKNVPDTEQARLAIEQLRQRIVEDMARIKQRVEEAVSQAEQTVTQRHQDEVHNSAEVDHTADPFEAAAKADQAMLGDQALLDKFFGQVEQEAKRLGQGFAEVRAGLLRKWSRHRGDQAWIDNEINSRQRRLNRGGNNARFENTLRQEIAMLRDGNFEALAQQVFNRNRDRVTDLTQTEQQATQEQQQQPQSWLARQRRRFWEGLPRTQNEIAALDETQARRAMKTTEERVAKVGEEIGRIHKKGDQRTEADQRRLNDLIKLSDSVNNYYLALAEQADRAQQEQQRQEQQEQQRQEQQAPPEESKPKPKPKPKQEPKPKPTEFDATKARTRLMQFARSEKAVEGKTAKQAKAAYDLFQRRYAEFLEELGALEQMLADNPTDALRAQRKRYLRLQKDAMRVGKALYGKGHPSRRDAAALAELERATNDNNVPITPEARTVDHALRVARRVIDERVLDLGARIEGLLTTMADPKSSQSSIAIMYAELQRRYQQMRAARDRQRNIPKVMDALREEGIADEVVGVLQAENLRAAAVQIIAALENTPATYDLQNFTLNSDPDGLLGFYDEVDTLPLWDDEVSVGLVNEDTGTFVPASAKRIRVRKIGKRVKEPTILVRRVDKMRKDLEEDGSPEALAALETLKNLDESQVYLDPTDFMNMERAGYDKVKWRTNRDVQSQEVAITEFDKDGGTSTRTIGEVVPWAGRADGEPYQSVLNHLEQLETDELRRVQMLGFTQPTITFRIQAVEGGHIIVAEQVDGAPSMWSKAEQGLVPVTEYLGPVLEEANRVGNRLRRSKDENQRSRIIEVENEGDIGWTTYDIPTLLRFGIAEVESQGLTNHADRPFETRRLALSVVWGLLRGPNGRRIKGFDNESVIYDRGKKFDGGKRYITYADLDAASPSEMGLRLTAEPGLVEAFAISNIYRARRALGMPIELIPNKNPDAKLTEADVERYAATWGVPTPKTRTGWTVKGMRAYLQKALDVGAQDSTGRVRSIDVLKNKNDSDIMTAKEIKAISAASKIRFPNSLRGLTVKRARQLLRESGSKEAKAALAALVDAEPDLLMVPDQYALVEKAGFRFPRNAHGITAGMLKNYLQNVVIAKAEAQIRTARRTAEYRRGLTKDKNGDGAYVTIHHGREGTAVFSDDRNVTAAVSRQTTLEGIPDPQTTTIDRGVQARGLLPMTMAEAEALAEQLRTEVRGSEFVVEPLMDGNHPTFDSFMVTERVGMAEAAPQFDQVTNTVEGDFEGSEAGSQDSRRFVDTEQSQLDRGKKWYHTQTPSQGTAGPQGAAAQAAQAALRAQAKTASRPQRKAHSVVFEDGSTKEGRQRVVQESKELAKRLADEIADVVARLDELRALQTQESSKPLSAEQSAEFDALLAREKALRAQRLEALATPTKMASEAKVLIESIVTRVANAMGLNYSFRIVTDHNRIPQLALKDPNTLPPAAVSFGWFLPDGSQSSEVTIFLNPQKLSFDGKAKSQAAILNALSHEMGHVVFWTYFDSLPVGLKQQLYQAWMSENPDMATTFDPENISREALLNDDLGRTFEEWMADQFVAYARDDASLLGRGTQADSVAARGVFARIADKLKQLWEVLTSELGLNQEYRAFADGIRRSMDPNHGPNHYTQAAWETNALPNDLPLNIVRFLEEANENGVQRVSRKLKEAVRKILHPEPDPTRHRDYTGFVQRVHNLGKAFASGNSRQVRDTLALTGEVVFLSMNARIRGMAEQYPALKKLVEEFKPAAGTEGISYRNRVHTEFSRFTVKLNKIMPWRDPLMDKAMLFELVGDVPGQNNPMLGNRLSEAQKQTVRDAVPQIRAVFDEMHKYATNAGIPLPYVRNYFPHHLDLNIIEMNAVYYSHQLRDKLGWDIQDARVFIAKLLGQTDHNRAQTTQEAAVTGLENDVQVVSVPWAEAVKNRSLSEGQFNEVFGDARQMDPRLTLHEYVSQLTRAAEFNRSFGQTRRPGEGRWDRTARLRAILADATEQGMTTQEYREVQTMVDTLMGRVGITMPGWQRNLYSGLVLYQNVRVLLFSVFSSFPDLATTVVRANSFQTVQAAWKADMKNVLNRDSDLYAMARAWGIASDAITKSVVAEYSSSNYLSGWAKNASEVFFKAIGLNAWTNFTRVAAMAVGKQFLVEHAMKAPTNADSAAKLQELSVTPADVHAWIDSDFAVYGIDDSVEAGGHSEGRVAELESLRRVRDAIVRFTDEAVLRPDASQRPTWASDPRFVLLWHLKSFMYAFHETLNKRIWYEMMKHKRTGGPINLLPLLHASLVFPLALIGLELREIIQYRLGGRTPRSRQLSAGQRMLDLTQRTGVLGPAQMASDMYGASQRNSWPVTGVIGPTFSHAYELAAKPWTQSGPKSIPVASQIPWLRDEIRPAFK